MVATGQNDYHLLYMSNDLVHNNVHRNAVALIEYVLVYSDCIALIISLK